MAEPLEFWVFALANLTIFGFGSILTALSFLAYRANSRSSSFRNATIGFGFVTLGGLIEPIYQIGIRGDYELSGREMLMMQGIEGFLVALGLGMLFYSIKRHNPSKRVSYSFDGDQSNSP